MSISSIKPLEQLHYGNRAEDPDTHAAISFWSPKFENAGGILTHELRDKWSQLGAIEQIGYFSINSVFPCYNSPPSPLTGLPQFKRDWQSLRWLNAVWVDIDQHNGPLLPFTELEERFEQARMAARLPVPAFLVSSGRGLWALWRLRSDKDHRTPVRAMPEQVAIWVRVERALIAQFIHLGADTACADAARIMRIPNSMNPKAPAEHEQVEWFAGESQATYSLSEMASLVGERSKKTAVTTAEQSEAKNPRRQAAGRKRWELAYAGFMHLLELRGGRVPTSARRNAVALAAYLLARLRRDPQFINVECHQLAIRCGLVASEVPKRVAYGISQARRPFARSMSIEQMCEKLCVTTAERAQIMEWQSQPRHVTKLPAVERKRQAEERRAAIAGKLSIDPNISTRELAALLGTSHTTVRRDIRLIGTRLPKTGDSPDSLRQRCSSETVTVSDRRVLVAVELESAGDLSVRELARRLREKCKKYKIAASPATIERDLQANRSQPQDYGIDEAIDSHYIRCRNGDLMRRELWEGEGIPEHGLRIVRSKRDDATINAVA